MPRSDEKSEQVTGWLLELLQDCGCVDDFPAGSACFQSSASCWSLGATAFFRFSDTSSPDSARYNLHFLRTHTADVLWKDMVHDTIDQADEGPRFAFAIGHPPHCITRAGQDEHVVELSSSCCFTCSFLVENIGVRCLTSPQFLDRGLHPSHHSWP